MEFIQGRTRLQFGLGLELYSSGPGLKDLKRLMDKVKLPAPVAPA